MNAAIVAIGGPMDGQLVEMGTPHQPFIRVPKVQELGLAPGDGIVPQMLYTLKTFHKVGMKDVLAYVAETTEDAVVNSRVEHIFNTKKD